MKFGNTFKDKTGMRFGRLVAITPIHRPYKDTTRVWWVCKCDCGEMSTVAGASLHSTGTKSCGCLLSESTRKRFTKHGHSPTGGKVSSEYKSWLGMHSRCRGNDPDNRRLYFDKHITVCERWNDFSAFLNDMGNKPTPRHSIDRKDGSKGYCPDNCRWATPKEQANNNSRNRPVTAFGKTRNIVEWAELVGISAHCISRRLFRGWKAERAVTMPPQPKIKNRHGGMPPEHQPTYETQNIQAM